MNQSVIERLAAHRIAGAIPREEIEWLAAHGREKRVEAGEIVSRKGDPVQGLFIFFSGRIALFMDRANGREKIIDWRAGDVGGMLPYSRLTTPPGDSIAEETTELLVIPCEDLPVMTRECQAFTAAVVHVMLDRARIFTTSNLHADKMARKAGRGLSARAE
jgi:CRP-like cAMP-binding protein